MNYDNFSNPTTVPILCNNNKFNLDLRNNIYTYTIHHI